MDEWLYDFRNWEIEQDEAEAYSVVFINQQFAALPRDILSIIRQKVWEHTLHDLLGRNRRRRITGGMRFFLNTHYAYLFLSKDS